MIKTIQKTDHLTKKDYLKAFESVLKHDFLPVFYKLKNGELDEYRRNEYIKNDELMEFIYSDRSIVFHAIDNIHHSSISQPSLIAVMLELADVQKGDHVLEIGTGSGYNAALLSKIVGANGAVYSAEIDEDIFKISEENLKSNQFKNVYSECKDGGLGFPEQAPFDEIIVTCATADITKYWIKQLKVGGKLICPLITRGLEVIAELTKVSEYYMEGKLHHYVHFYRMGGQFSILTHYTYTKKELKTLNKIIHNYANIDEDFSETLSVMTKKELNDFYFYLSLHNPSSICFYDAEVEEMKRGYGLFMKSTGESGIAIIFNKKLHVWGSSNAHNILLEEFDAFRKAGSPGVHAYKLRVYANENDMEKKLHDRVIVRKNSITVFELL